MRLLLADENSPYPSFKFLLDAGEDIKHIIDVSPSITDHSVIDLAIAEDRLIVTFDSDFGDLIFKEGLRPPGVIYFRWEHYKPRAPGQYLQQLFEEDQLTFVGFLTVIGDDKIRQRKMPV